MRIANCELRTPQLSAPRVDDQARWLLIEEHDHRY
jgi:hypothetical protein